VAVARLAGVGLAAVLALAVLVGGAAPASAHTLTGVPPTNYRSQILAIDPPVPGLHVSLLDLGRRIRLVNAGSVEVMVLGYQREPYLRVGPDGVFENRRSPAVYQNKVVSGSTTGTTLPPQADASAPPEWHRISTGHTAIWRDQRTRWEGRDPPEVAQAPTLTQVVVPTWTIELRKGDTPVLLEGRITWVPGPSPWPWVALALVLVVGCGALARWRHWGPALSGCVAAMVAIDAVRSLGVAMAGGGSIAGVAVTVLLGGLVSVVAWVVGVRSIAALQQSQERGSLAAGAAGLFIGFYSLSDLPVLSRSQVPQAFSSTFARVAVATSLGLGFGLVVAAIIIERRNYAADVTRGRLAAITGGTRRPRTPQPRRRRARPGATP
jgi:hypothetical protein